jgi:hypothetical protein
MAKKKDDTVSVFDNTEPLVIEVSSTPAPVVTTLAPAPVVPLLSFDRYFSTTGKPAHHKAGMRAFLTSSGTTDQRRTKDDWEKIFANY